jgi:SGF29 tudor-like domain
VFDLPEQQVIVLSGTIERLTKGDIVFAVYPDTTSFYQATVVQAPRKQGVGGQYVMVNFVDDSDEFGITHDKAVPIEHVMPPPMG